MKPQKTVGWEDTIPPSPRVFGPWGGAGKAWGGARKAWRGARKAWGGARKAWQGAENPWQGPGKAWQGPGSFRGRKRMERAECGQIPKVMKENACSATLKDNVRVVKVNASTSPPKKETVILGSGPRGVD